MYVVYPKSTFWSDFRSQRSPHFLPYGASMGGGTEVSAGQEGRECLCRCGPRQKRPQESRQESPVSLKISRWAPIWQYGQYALSPTNLTLLSGVFGAKACHITCHIFLIIKHPAIHHRAKRQEKSSAKTERNPWDLCRTWIPIGRII